MVSQHLPGGNGDPLARPAIPRRPAAALAVLLLVALPDGAAGQDPAPAEDAFRDPAAHALVLRARAAREREVEGIQSYEGVLRERIYVGLTALSFRRERGLFEQERIARIRWTDQGERAVQWIGARRAIPIVGADTRVDGRPLAEEGGEGPGEGVRRELRNDLPAELLGDTDLPSFAFDPGGGDRLTFGDDWALHPLADTATAHYRYGSGDTLRLGLPDRDLVLYEIRVEPRRADFHLVAASLWFEAETAALVRATYRPARPFDLELDEPEDAEDVPGFLRPVVAEIRFITVEYSLHELRFWLPRRFAMEGEARLGGVARIPLTVEWNIRDYRINEASVMPLEGPLPRGWSRHEERVEENDGTVRYVTVVVPDRDSLMASPELSAGLGPRAAAAFSDQEVQELRDELESLLPTYRLYRPDFAWGLERGLVRFNRVEGLSLGVAGEVPLSPRTRVTATARLGTGDREPYGTLALRHGPEERPWTLEGYHRLESMNDRDDPFSLPGSLTNLLLGTDRGEYVRTTGAAVGHTRTGRTVRWHVEAFGERQAPVTLTTDFFVLGELGLRDDTVNAVRAADRVDVLGVRGRMDWYRGIDPDGLILTGGLRAEVGRGDAGYQRIAGRGSLGHPLLLGLDGALELEGGAVWGSDIPVQRSYFLGGTETLRGFNANGLLGESFWRARAELASGFPGARAVLFGDAGWIGPRADFSDRAFDPDRILVSAGVGASLLDGLFRVDLARALRGGSGWKVHAYFDGLF